jgi:hypothetical protein
MPSQHIWTERTADGAKREVRAIKFGGAWRLQAKTSRDLEWTYYKRPLLEDLLALKEIIVRKYQRRRASSEDVTSVEKLIAEQAEVASPRYDRSGDTPQRGVHTRDEIN